MKAFLHWVIAEPVYPFLWIAVSIGMMLVICFGFHREAVKWQTKAELLEKLKDPYDDGDAVWVWHLITEWPPEKAPDSHKLFWVRDALGGIQYASRGSTKVSSWVWWSELPCELETFDASSAKDRFEREYPAEFLQSADLKSLDLHPPGDTIRGGVE